MPTAIRAATAAAIVVLAAAPVHAQTVDVDPGRATSFEQPIPIRLGELISSDISDTDFHVGLDKRTEQFAFTGRAGQVVTARTRSDIPNLEVVFMEAGSYKVLARGQAKDAPLSATLPKDGTYFLIVGGKGRQRFGKYLLSLGLGDTAPPFDSPLRAPVQVARASAPASPVASTMPSAPPAARPTTPTPFESPQAWGMFAEVAKIGGLVPSSSKASFALANMANGSPFIFKIYKVASDGLLYRLEFTPNAAEDLRAWRGQITPEGSVLWSPLHGFYDRGRTERDDLMGDVQRTRVFNPDGSTWGPWDNRIVLFRNLLSEDGVLAVQRQLDRWEPRFDATIAEIERQGIATDGADDARWARQRALRESNDRTFAALSAAGSALSAAQAEASASEARSSAALQATLEGARRRQNADSALAGQAPPTDASEPRRPSSQEIAETPTAGPGSTGPTEMSGQPSGAPNRAAAGQPLRFMLELGLRNPINGINGVCFSSVITVPGPAGWPVEGESTRAAMALVEPYRARMRQACAEKAALQDSAPANIIWNSRGRETTPEDSVARWRALKQLEISLP